MTLTMFLVLTIWLSGSYIEFLFTRWFAPINRLYSNLLGGIVFSAIITGTLGFITGGGTVAAAAGALSIATSRITKPIWAGMHDAAEFIGRGRQQMAKVKEFKNSHPRVYSEALEGFKMGIKFIGVTIALMGWLILLPFRVIRWIHNGYTNLRARFS